jgi:hypothetical protein
MAVLRTPSGAAIGAALIASAAGWALAVAFGAWIVALPLAIAVIAAGAALALHPLQVAATPARLIEKVSQQAESGRKLVIYERETGLFAHWYLALRGEEECGRAGRYQRALSLVVVEPRLPEGAWGVKDELASWVGQHLRATDVAAYFGNGRYVLLLPETDGEGTDSLLARIRADVSGVALAVADYGTDGSSYDELYACASGRLTEDALGAA